MFGKNPQRKPEKSDGSSLFIQEIFHTLQGEAIFAGQSAIFIRLGGCNLACSFCDTEFENFKALLLSDVLAKVRQIKTNFPKTKLIVITGGEPLRQNITPLCQELLNDNFTVQIETNGTLFLPDFPKEVIVICSPKYVNGKYLRVCDGLMDSINALKFVVSDSLSGYSNVPDWVSKFEDNIKIYVQPMDEYDENKNKKNLELATEIALNQGYTLSLQTHKIINLP